jgi:putative membrane protein insertion efficiency factor
MKSVLIRTIRLYQTFISPILGNNCRFYPTCSEYAVMALEKYGILKGTLKTIWRILRCNPLSSGGVDYP